MEAGCWEDEVYEIKLNTCALTLTMEKNLQLNDKEFILA